MFHSSLEKPNLPYEEWTALMDFYKSTNGEYWRYKGSRTNTTVRWNFTHYPTNNPCFDQWTGIECNCHRSKRYFYNDEYYYNYYSSGDLVSQCSVTSLRLTRSNLTGTITSRIGTFRNLTNFHLYSNNLYGTLPEQIGLLKKLKSFGLNENYLTGTIPSAFGNLIHLSNLLLGSNFLTGTIPSSFENLKNLVYFNLTNTLLTGTIPSFIGNFTRLIYLLLFANHLTGTIPSSFGYLTSLMDLKLFSNFLSGSIPGKMKQLNFLVYLDLSENLLSKTIPASIGNIISLQDLGLSSNFLTGTIPKSFRNFTELENLVLNSNILEGSISNLFDASKQIHLSIIIVNNNQLTGSIPKEIFELPKLSTFCAVRNCFSGDIPYETICKSKTLINLILDGLYTATSCRQLIFPGSSLFSSSYILNNNIFNNTLDPCVFSVNLTTLHLSGNGFTGSLPNNVNISDNLVDLSLSHNLMTGSIPNSFQSRKWSSLDLAFNRFSGTLFSDFSNQSSHSRFFLQRNRLSGHFPSSLLEVNTITALTGNIFSCDSKKSDIPQHDSDFANYNCGSNSFDVPYYAWLGIICFLVFSLGVWRFICLKRYDNSSFFTKLYSYWVGMHRSSKRDVLDDSLSNRDDRVALTIDKLKVHMNTVFSVMLYIISVLLTIYTVDGSFYSIYSYQYAWIVSIAFQSGNFAMWLSFSGLCFLLWFLLILTNRQKRHLESIDRKLCSLKSPNMEEIILEKEDSKKQKSFFISFISSLKWSLTPIINVIVVGGVNIIYVILYFSQSSGIVVFLQFLLAMFKSYWNTFGYHFVSRVINSQLDVDDTSKRHSLLQLFIRLLNNIVIPCVVVAVINEDCFYNLFVAAPPVTASFKYKLCIFTNYFFYGTCSKYDYFTKTTNFDAPFYYSYQCSSRFITYYAPAFVFLCIIDGFIVPLVQVVSVQLYKYGVKNKTNWIPFLQKVMPMILQTDRIDTNAKRDKFRSYFDSLELFLSNFTYLGLIMTFGAVFPPLAFSFFVTIYLMNLSFLFKVDRFVNYAREKNRMEFIEVINEKCEGCLNHKLVMRSVWMIIVISCLFYSLFLFDTLGDSVGVSGAYWVLIVMPLVPVVTYLGYRIAIRFGFLAREPIDNNNNNNNNNNNYSIDNNVRRDSVLGIEIVENVTNPINKSSRNGDV